MLRAQANMSWSCKPHASVVFRTNSTFSLCSSSSFAVRNVRPSSPWHWTEVYCLHAEKSGDSVSFCERSQTKPNQHVAGHRHTGGNLVLWRLSNRSISHHENWWRHFMRQIELTGCSSVNRGRLSDANVLQNCSSPRFFSSFDLFSVFRLFTSHAGSLDHDALSFLCLWCTGLRRNKGRRGVQVVDMWKWNTDPRLWAFLKSTCFVLLRTRTPLAPFAHFALVGALT